MRARPCLLLAIGLLMSAMVLAQSVSPSTSDERVARGHIIYTKGQLPSGEPLRAERGALGVIQGEQAACVQCHRPSGMGGFEGGLMVPPIVGDRLFVAGQAPPWATRIKAAWLRHQSRSAYGDRSLDRALRLGLDPDEQRLHIAMPRYTLDDEALRDLAAYLRAMSMPRSDLGPSNTLHLATVLTPDAPAHRRDAVHAAMAAWSQGHAYGQARVQWQAWTLTGPANTWPEQLNQHWRAQPVFALVSGAGSTRWQAVADFCETRRVACVMPSLDTVPTLGRSGAGHSVYLSSGTRGEASMFVQYLRQEFAGQRPRVSVWHDDDAGLEATEQLMALSDTLVVQRMGSATTDDREGVPDATVLWLRPEALERWFGQARPTDHRKVYVSAQLAPPQTTQVPPAWREQVVWLSMRSDPLRFAAGAALGLEPWRQRLGLAAQLDPVTLGDVYAATSFFSDAMAATFGRFDVPFLLERIEVAVDRRPAASAYHAMSLGPNQRLATQGGTLIAFQRVGDRWPVPVSAFIRAELERD